MKVSQCYIASFGLITSIGANAKMNQASFRAGINRYALSDYRLKNFNPVSLALIPEKALPELTVNLPAYFQTSMRYSRIILAAELALKELFSQGEWTIEKNMPIFQACPEFILQSDEEFNELLIDYVIEQTRISEFIELNTSGSLLSGRSGVLNAIEHTFQYFEDTNADFALVGGSDSFDDPMVLNLLDNAGRLNGENVANGFTPGDGAGYLLLTRQKKYAMNFHGRHVYFLKPAIGYEEGHLLSEHSYQGDGLADCFNQLFLQNPTIKVNAIYSSMNGENYWAKEYGVAITRNHQHFSEAYVHKHPADCYGDIGAASGAALMILSAFNLVNKRQDETNLIYCSSDRGHRCSILMKTEVV
ncbi:beta-ketoacyl synthase N-terminal-like domain-containing protein [Aliikangiella sp. IMCC44359]|uniref:beta-ketoacyl synthase N-terminal-like domain-containing protein n=1 Tax=Aliikangiella sp. IMCC44359 TaxID=3459125 RepID=UPI00403AC9C5